MAFEYYATREISAYNIEIDKKVSLGLLDEERANKMKEEISRKIDILIQTWSEAGEKRLKEKLAELCSTKEDAEPEEVLEGLIDKPKEFELTTEKKKARKIGKG